MDNLMRKLVLLVVVLAFTIPSFAAVKFFTDYPNSVPVGSDFFVLQRNQSYINASDSQIKGDWFNNPVFTGNGSIIGNWVIGGIYYGNGLGLSNITALATNTYFQTITNNTFVNTNVSFLNIVTNNTFINTNVSFLNIVTNNLFVNTNVSILNIVTNNQFITTNITVNVPGGITNLNLTPSSLMQSDVNDAEASVANGSGVLTNNGAGVFGWAALSGLGGNFVLANNGNGTNTTNWGVSTFQEVDAQNFFPTNLFTGHTNAVLLKTDANGLLSTTDFTVATNEVTRQINSPTNIYSSLGNAISDISTATNLSYGYKIRTDIGNGVVTFGQGIFTNISADRTLASFTYGLIGANGYETAIIGVTNSDTAVHTLTMPANVIGKPGKTAPGVFYITNGVCTQISVAHMMNLFTNATTDF